MKTLTGNWYLKKRWFGYIVMVEIKETNLSTLIDEEKEIIYYKKASSDEIVNLNIKCA